MFISDENWKIICAQFSIVLVLIKTVLDEAILISTDSIGFNEDTRKVFLNYHQICFLAAPLVRRSLICLYCRQRKNDKPDFSFQKADFC